MIMVPNLSHILVGICQEVRGEWLWVIGKKSKAKGPKKRIVDKVYWVV